MSESVPCHSLDQDRRLMRLAYFVWPVNSSR